MNKLIQQIELIERIDQLIRMKATGCPKEFANDMNISKASLYRLIETMKELGAPIEYSIIKQSFVYVDHVNFICGFYFKELSYIEVKQINGGFNNLSQLVNF